jgi:hypothetical protein
MQKSWQEDLNTPRVVFNGEWERVIRIRNQHLTDIAIPFMSLPARDTYP